MFNPEKFPFSEIPITGKAPEETKDEVREVLRDIKERRLEELPEKFPILSVFAQMYENLKQSEKKEKTAQELAAVEFASRVTNEWRFKYGMRLNEITAQDIIFPSKADFREFMSVMTRGLDASAHQIESVYGITHPLLNAIVLNPELRKAPLKCALVMTHESFHTSSYKKLEVEENENREQTLQWTTLPRRRGLAMIPPLTKKGVGRESYFLGLDEAITEELTRRALPELLKIPEFQEEKELVESIEQNKKEMESKYNTAKKLGVPAQELVAIKSKHGTPEFYAILYSDHRKVLSYLVQEISQTLALSEDEAFGMFARAYFTGEVLSIARAIERTFGEGSFRLIGEMNENPRTARRVFKELEDMRYDTKGIDGEGQKDAQSLDRPYEWKWFRGRK